MRTCLTVTTIALTLASSLVACSSTPPTDGQEFSYEGKSIEIVVGVGPGGTIDTTARLLQKELSEALPGTRIQVINTPGGGGMEAANNFTRQPAHDGTRLILMSQHNIMPMVLGIDDARYGFDDFAPLVLFPRGASTIMSSNKTDLTSLDAFMKATDIKFGGISVVSDDLPALVGFELIEKLDDIDTILGFESGSATRQDLIAGGIDLRRDGTTNYINELQDSTIPLYTHGVPDGDGGIARDPLLPEIPHAGEVYEQTFGQPPQGEAWNAFTYLLDVLGTGGYFLAAHSDAPPGAIEALDAALSEISADDNFNAQITDLFGPYELTYGDDARAWADQMSSAGDAERVWLTQFLAENFPEQS
ncbi:MAG: hypothetical protein WBB07_24925 [Mycobacterium sp.]